MKVLLTGATGFVGSHILPVLLRPGHTVRALVRDPARLPQQAGLEGVRGDVVTGEGVETAAEGCEAVIHLVGIIVESRGATFDLVHYEGTRNVVAAAQRAGVRRFVQMSALGVRANGVSGYQMSKWRGEEEVRQSGIPYVILRPSVIYGPRDGFVTQMVEVMRVAPLVRPVPGHGRYPYRPIYIDDAVRCFVKALTNEAATNQTIDLGGADELTLDAMLAEIARCIGIRKAAVHVPFWVMYLNASLLGAVMRRPPVTTDQLRMLAEGSTCDITKMREVFDLNPLGFRAGLTQYLCKTNGIA